MRKPKVVIYGLGKQYKERRRFLEKVFDISAYSDSRVVETEHYIRPEEICNCEYDYVYITSNRYFDEIKRDLINKLNINANKILGEKDTCWYIDNSLNRNKWVINKLREIPENQILLDAGAGEQRYRKYCSHLRYISQDFGQYSGENNLGGLQPVSWNTSNVDIVSDIVNIPLEDNSVDAILCTEVFEHIKDPLLALREFRRICKKDGILLLTAPVCSLTHFAPYYFANGFSKYWYEEHLSNFGFEIVELEPNGNYFDYLRQELLRISSVANKYCKGDVEEKAINNSIMNSVVMLKNLSEHGNDSSELLCFGYMVKAKKVR